MFLANTCFWLCPVMGGRLVGLGKANYKVLVKADELLRLKQRMFLVDVSGCAL